MKRIEDQADHAALVKGAADDRARADFAFSLRNFITSELMPANRTVFDRRAAREYERANGGAPATPAEVREAMEADPFYRFYLSARRTTQELIWSAVVPAVEKAEPPIPPQPTLGTLRLDSDLQAPRYLEALDIHCMPGGYLADRGEADTAAGAVYDRGVYLYMSGLMGPLNDGIGRLAVAYLKRTLPDFAPRRILDLGCGVGHSTLPWAAAYPEADLYGVDAGAALLRHAHARAESLGVRVHFVQADAEATGFDAASFDLVTSHIVLHETSTRALPAILRECYRLLRPGGYMLHVDQPGFAGLDAFQCFLQENETYYNNEPFWRRYRGLDLGSLAVEAGFAPGHTRLDLIPAAVVQQSQNNERVAGHSEEAKKRGFSALLARKA